MNTEMRALRDLDPAPKSLTSEQQQRAELLLESLTRPDAKRKPRTSRRRAWARRGSYLPLLSAAAAIVVGVLLVVNPSGPGVSSAIASWTPAAEVVSQQDLALTETVCREHIDPAWANPDELPVTLAERRGDVVAILFYQSDPDTAASCVAVLPPGSDRVRDVSVGTGAGDGAAQEAKPGTIIQGAVSQFNLEDQMITVVTGSVGADIDAVYLNGPMGETQATLNEGRFAAWLPGAVFVRDSEEASSSPKLTLTYDVRFADGSLQRNMEPSHPAG